MTSPFFDGDVGAYDGRGAELSQSRRGGVEALPPG